MKKKFLTFILSICFIIPCMFMFSACSTTPANIEFKVENGYIQYYDGSNWNNLIAIEELEGEDGDDADIWTIGADGYWYKNGSKTNKKAVGDIGATGNGIKSIAPSSDPLKTNAVQTTYIITLDDNSTYEFVVKNGTNGDDADIWTIGADGYWYKNGSKTDNKAIGNDGDEYTIGEDGYWYLNGEKTEYKAIGEDSTYSTYSISYDYNFNVDPNLNFNISTLFDNYKTNESIKSTEWVVDMPALKENANAEIDGWYIKGTNKKLSNYDFVGGNVNLELRWNYLPSGLYENNTYKKTWEQIKEEYPEAIDGNTINYLQKSNGATSYFTDLSGTFVLDKEIEIINDYSFNDCENLTNIILPSSIKNVGYGTLFNCPNLQFNNFKRVNYLGNLENPYLVAIGLADKTIETVDFHNDCKLIAGGSFTSNTIISKINISENIETIGKLAFWNCSSLEELLIPSNVKTIKNGAFNRCGFKSVIIEEGLQTIEQGAFLGCANLTEIRLPNSLENIDVEYDSNVLATEKLKFNVYENGNYIGNKYNPYLILVSLVDDATSCTINKDCKFILDTFYTELQHLTSIKVESGNKKFDSRESCNAVIETSTKTLFFGCVNSTIPNTVTKIGRRAFMNCDLISFNLPSQITEISAEAFWGCEKLENITVSTDNEIYDSRNNCNAIIEISSNTLVVGCKNTMIPNTVKNIGDYAFESLDSLTKIIIPEGVESIGNYSFDFSGIEYIVLPKTIKYIGYRAFWYCQSLDIVYYTGTQADWNSISIEEENTELKNATRYYYSSTEPTGTGNYWHYDTDGVTPIAW